jgi:hypothetical protein
MSQLYHQAMVAAGMHVTYQVHPGAHDGPDFLGEVTAMLKWGLFKPVVTDPASWTNTTVATSGQLWDFNYRFTNPPTQVVQFKQSGTTLSGHPSRRHNRERLDHPRYGKRSALGGGCRVLNRDQIHRRNPCARDQIPTRHIWGRNRLDVIVLA